MIFYRYAIITQNINLFSNFLTTQQSCFNFVHLTNPFTGWHIECSAMSRTHLGKTIDLHCGGHREAEKAP